MVPVTLFGELKSTTSYTAPGGRLYTNGAACPRPCPAFCEAMAITPENIGVARLVPPTTPTLNCPPMVWMISPPSEWVSQHGNVRHQAHRARKAALETWFRKGQAAATACAKLKT
jgi:hypothetical protein